MTAKLIAVSKHQLDIARHCTGKYLRCRGQGPASIGMQIYVRMEQSGKNEPARVK
jgi:hypothetical protein